MPKKPESEPSTFHTDFPDMELSEICQADHTEDLDLQDLEPIKAMHSRSLNTRITVEAELKKVARVRILQMGLRTLCCKRLIMLRRNRETNVFELELPPPLKYRMDECLDCCEFEFDTKGFELKGAHPVLDVGRCNLPPSGFVVSSVSMLGYCQKEWSKRS